MRTFKTFLTEMAVPSHDIKNMTVYHGTTSREAALGIAKHGIVPPVLPQKKTSLTPVEGKAYVTPHIHYAQIYAMGGNIAGSSRPMSHHATEPHGYVFAAHGHDLHDVQPDEDSVGEMIYKKTHSGLSHLAKTHLGDATLNKVHEGDYGAWARAGKTLLKKMPDDMKLDLIHKGAHIAHGGVVKPHSVYRIHHSKIPLLKSDGSNFFDHAEKINFSEI